ncbi:hypothetical protein BDN67DRAFT_972769 [Paxillus ammoniavirescens]|nr:hypothetical protein BDN67DRAFT_972769 [Paxillus ammoniavirescens]
MTSPVVDFMQVLMYGTLVTVFLYGIFCMQTFYYARNYARDRLILKWLVVFLWILETVHLALSIHVTECYLIMNFDDPPALEYVIWSIGATAFVGYVVIWAVDLCFVWRIWQLSRRTGTCIFLVILATAPTALGFANCVLSVRHPYVPEFLAVVFPTMVAGWILAAIADSLIAIALCYYLHRCRSGMRRTEHIINRLLLYSINTGALAALFAIITIVLYVALPGTMVFAAFVQVQSKLYGISLLASLNARKATLAYARMAVPTVGNVPLQFLANNGGMNNIDDPNAPDETLSPSVCTKNIKVGITSDEDSLRPES